jgi:hypothetical protein
MNKKLFLTLLFLPLIFSGCSLSSVPYVNKIAPKETVTKIVFQQNEKIDSLADFAKRADALAKEKWAPDAMLKTISFSNTDSFLIYSAQFSSDQIKIKEGRPGDLTIYYDYASTGVIDSYFPGIKIHNFSPQDNSTIIGLSCLKGDFCGDYASISSGQQINPDNLKISQANLDKCLNSNKNGTILIRVNDATSIPKGSVVLQCGSFRLNAYTDQEFVNGISSNNSVVSTSPIAATTIEKIATSSVAINVNKDSDNDGLTDADEAKYGTDPNNSDTDDDKYFDGAEVVGGYNPLGAGKMTAAQLSIRQQINTQLIGSKKIIIYYTSLQCPDCKEVENFLKDNKIEGKIEIEKKDILGNINNTNESVDKAKFCKGDNPYPFVYPLLWDGSKCFFGKDEVINFFQYNTR